MLKLELVAQLDQVILMVLEFDLAISLVVDRAVLF